MLNKFKIVYLLTIFNYFLIACTSTGNSNSNEEVNNNVIPAPAKLQFEVIGLHPHDTSAYTEGLEWYGNSLLESTGNYKHSKLRLLDSNMKDIKTPIKLADEYFGEGTTIFKDKIYQLTWKEHKVFVYDVKTFKKISEYYWPYEGWGMTHDDSAIIVNTGGSNIYYVNPNDFSVQKTLGVYNNFGYVSNINELEYVNGKLYANVYLTDNIVQIDPKTGAVNGVADLTNILTKVGVKNDPKNLDPGNVLNGIAYHDKKGTFFITGKYWPVLIEIKFK
jgi:glutamine cyclotransferase